jgi:hypothetical protein
MTDPLLRMLLRIQDETNNDRGSPRCGCSGRHPCLPYPAASCRPVENDHNEHAEHTRAGESSGWKPDDTAGWEACRYKSVARGLEIRDTVPIPNREKSALRVLCSSRVFVT